MIPRELVRRTLEFTSPARIPRHAWILPWAEQRYSSEVSRLRSDYPDDIVTAPGLYTSPLPVVGGRYEKGAYIDEWGCRFTNTHDGVIGNVREPLIADWDGLDRFATPQEPLLVDRDGVEAFCCDTDRFVLAGTLVRPFERLIFIRTMEQALVDLLLQPPPLVDLLARIHQHYVREVEAWAQSPVDAIVIMDDWGTQNRMMVSPELWRRIYKPYYREYCEVARHYGKYVFMHSDGYILDIIPDLIEIGVHAINSQMNCMGVSELERFAGRVTFWGELDRQHLMVRGTGPEIRRVVREAHEHLYRNGGVIAQCEFGPGAQPENVFEVFRAWNAVQDKSG